MPTDPTERVRALVRDDVLATRAYHVPAAGDMIKLDAMENPYPWPGELMDDWLAALRNCQLNRYPDPAAHALRAAIKTAMQVPDGNEVLLGNGSDELIQVMLMALAKPGAAVLAPEPGFVMYRVIAEALGLAYVGVPLAADDFSLSRDAMLAAIATHRPAVIFLAYPNNPTGNLFASSDIDAIIAATDGLVVIDEAYLPFAGATCMQRLAYCDNVVIMRTVSKMGLAGLRLGYLLGAPAWLNEFDKLRLPYNINSLTQASALFALQHKARLDEQTATLVRERQQLADALSAIDGVESWPSKANFILLRVANAASVFARLQAAGVLIKNLDGGHPLLVGCLRVTVGTPAENQAFLNALADALR